MPASLGSPHESLLSLNLACRASTPDDQPAHSPSLKEPVVEPSDEVAYIAVMGPTGTGKSTFINTATRSAEMQVSAGLEGCTQQVQISVPSTINGRTVVFIDTPGFDDSMRGDADILRTISAHLAALCKGQQKLAGIIYLKDISHIRMSGSACRNLRLFRKLCGDDSLCNVAILTTMWGNVSEEEGVARQRNLEDGDSYFKPMIDHGATVFRHDNTAASADRVVEHFFTRAPTTLQIQAEIVHERRELAETEAGKELREQIDTRTSEVSNEVAALRVEMAEAEELNDDDSRREILEALGQAQAELERLKKENAALTRGDIMQDTLLTSLSIAAVGRVAGPAGVVAAVGAVCTWKLLRLAWNRLM